jgi:hypothetical protein
MAEIRLKSTGTIKLFENDNTSSVTIASPASLGADRTITLPDASVTLASGTMNDATNLSGTVPIANGGTGATTLVGAGLANTPAFDAYMSAVQSVTDNALTKVVVNTEVYDSDGCYDNSTNYRFTPTTAGKYYVYGAVTSLTDVSQTKEARAMIYKNGAALRSATIDPRDNYGYMNSNYVAAIIDMDGSSDYVELYGTTNKEGGTDCKFTNVHYQSTYFGAYKIIT